MVHRLLTRNTLWSDWNTSKDPDYFSRLANQQTPEFFWIGCSDSRLPANVIAGLDPGEVFVHRNVANVVHSSDLNMLTALEYAVESLKVTQIIVCGHYGCGGVKAATEAFKNGLIDHWLEPIRQLAQRHIDELDQCVDEETRCEKLAELNVIDGVRCVAQTPILQKAWARGDDIVVHGLIYGLKSGRLSNLDCTIGPPVTN